MVEVSNYGNDYAYCTECPVSALGGIPQVHIQVSRTAGMPEKVLFWWTGPVGPLSKAAWDKACVLVDRENCE